MQLILAEKPSVACDIARVVGSTKAEKYGNLDEVDINEDFSTDIEEDEGELDNYPEKIRLEK
jgi:hypothetical protein